MKFTYVKNAVFFFLFTCGLSVSAQINAEYIWGGPNSLEPEYSNSTFNGGMHDWTTEGLESAIQDSAHNAVWRWDENGEMANGTYWGSVGKIESPSVANGAVGFDSDYYDGSGLAPYPQKSVLTSPSMDCTGEDRVSVMFYESYRQWNAHTSLEVSNDGGNTWVPYPIPFNDDVSSNSSTGGDAWTYINITATAANQADVRVRFVWEGGYYYWILDDVALIKSPQNDLAIVDFFYPAGSYAQPALTGVSCDTMGFNCVIRNVAGVERTDVTVYVEVTDDSGVIYADSVLLETVAASAYGTAPEDTVVFDALWSPGNVEGNYSITYSLKDAMQDFNPDDNADGDDYIITTNTFAKGSGVSGYPFPAADITSFFAEGSFYRTCDFDNSMNNLEVAVDSMGFACSSQDGEIGGASVELWIKKVINPEFKYPEVTMSASMTENDGIGWAQKGYAVYTYADDSLAETMVWLDQFTDFFGDDIDVVIDPYSEYLAMVETSVNKNSLGLVLGYSSNMNYGSGGGIILQDPGGVYGGWAGSTANPQIVLKLKILMDSKLPKLPDNVITVMPNPVQDQLNLKLDFAYPTDISFALGTMTGSLLKTGQWKNAQNETQTLDVSNLPNGQYLVRIQTTEGIATKMFVVAR